MDIDAPKAVLLRFASEYGAGCVESSIHSKGFSGASIFRVESSPGIFALRQWPVDSLPAERIRGLHRWLAHLSHCGISQISVPVAALDGDTLVFAEGHYWQLEPWMPGEANFHQQPSDAKLIAAMHCLANIHTASLAYRPRPKSQDATWFDVRDNCTSPAVVERLERLRRWSARDFAKLGLAGHQFPHDVAVDFVSLFDRTAPSVIWQLDRLARKRFQLCPCLRDVWHDHVLFIGEEVTGIIDPSACRFDNVAVDLSRLIGSLVGNDPHGWNVALDAYSTRRKLTRDELRLVKALDHSGVLLSGMTWIERRYLKGETFEDPARIQARLESFLERMREMDRFLT